MESQKEVPQNVPLSSDLNLNLKDLLDSTAERARFEEKRMREEKENKRATVRLLEETEKKNRLLQEVLEATRSLFQDVRNDLSPKVTALEVKIDVLVRIQGLLVTHMMPKSKESDKTVRILADLIKEVKGGHVNITADSVSAGADLNMASTRHHYDYVGD
jgi:hypothetical protein